MRHLEIEVTPPTRIIATILAASWILVGCSSVAAPAAERPAASLTKPETPGVANFSRIDGSTGRAGSTVGFGGATQASAMPVLKQAGFALVINLRLATEPGVDVDAARAAAGEAGLKYIHLPFDAANPDPDLVDKFFAVVTDRNNQPVYIHCSSANRVGALWMILRVLGDGWEMDPARAEARAIGLTAAVAEQFAAAYISSHSK